MDWMGRYITKMETKGCASLAHIGKSLLCICSKLIDAHGIVLSCEKKIINVWKPLDALGAQNSMDWMSRDILEMSTPTENHHLLLENRNDVCFDASWHIELHMVERINMIWSHINEFHVWWESKKCSV